MNLPFSPKFFSEINVFEMLIEFEKENKSTWEAEKIFLVWAASPEHAHRGTPLGTDHVGNTALTKAKKEKKLSKNSEAFIDRNNADIILRSLGTRNLGKYLEGEKRILLNQNGYIAGRILEETNLLKNKEKYQNWLDLWWLIFRLAIAVIVLQAISLYVDILNKSGFYDLVWLICHYFSNIP